jgi:spore coat protein U-like protein
MCVGLLILAPPSAFAGSGACSVSATPLRFGTYNTADSTPLTSTATITYLCEKSAQAKSIVIWIDKGLYAPTNNPRQMANGSERLDYYLYLDAARTAIWGDSSSNQYTSSPANGVTYEVPVYGLIPAQRDVSAGPYSDSLVVTLNW